MILWLLSLAHAFCPSPRPANEVFEHAVPPIAPIHVFTWQDARTTALNLRIRDGRGRPVDIAIEVLGEGSLRLSPPPGGWPTATLTLEERASFTGEGRRAGALDAVHHTAWFRIATVDVVAGPVDQLLLPTVTWTRGPRAVPLLGNKATVAAQFSMDTFVVAAIELEGHGEIVFTQRDPDFPHPLMSMENLACNCTLEVQDLPQTGDLRARLVVRTQQGQRANTPWTTLGPKGPRSDVGSPARPWRMDRWEFVERGAQDDHPPVTTIGACSRLVVAEQDVTPIAPGTGLLQDDAGGLHVVVHHDGVIRLDGVVVPSTVRSILAKGNTTYVHSGNHVLRLTDGSLHSTWSPDDRIVGLERDEVSLLVVMDEGHDRMRVRLSEMLTPIGHAEKVLEPILLTQQGLQALVNGVRVSTEPVVNQVIRPDRVALMFRNGRLTAYDVHATELWTVHTQHPGGDLIETDHGLAWSELDAGNHAIWRQVDWDGQLLPTAGEPQRLHAGRASVLDLGGRNVYQAFSGDVTVETAQGSSVPHQVSSTRVVEGERIHSVSIRAGERTDTWLTCDPQLIGIPTRYTPHRSSR